MKLFLDDVRQPEDCFQYMHARIGGHNSIYMESWVIVRNYDDFVKAIDENHLKITHISFDHDLADEHYDPSMFDSEETYQELYHNFTEKTGYDCAKWLKEFYNINGVALPIMFVHSMNPVGTRKIIELFK